MDIEQAIINALATRPMTSGELATALACGDNTVSITARRLQARRKIHIHSTEAIGAVVVNQWAIGPSPAPAERSAAGEPADAFEAMARQLGGGA